MQKEMYADFYQALCFFAVILKTKIFSSTLASFGPQNIYEKNKKTICLFLKILNYLNSIIVLNTLFTHRSCILFQICSPKLWL